MKVLIRGLGNLGTTLTHVFLAFRHALGISEVIAQKGTPMPYLEADLKRISDAGANIVRGTKLPAWVDPETFIVDCRAPGMPRASQGAYAQRGLRALAQGTETGFGALFVTGFNDATIRGARAVQIASCNAHGIVAILRALGSTSEQIRHADFVVVRRSEDLGSHARLVAASVVARHAHAQGTHHAETLARLYASVGKTLSLSCSDVTTPSQLLHTLRFSVELSERATQVMDRFRSAELISSTEKFDSNAIFELGRRYGFQGRIFEHAIVVDHDLRVDRIPGGTRVQGWAFVPQEGNTILSTMDAFLLQTEHAERARIRAQMIERLTSRAW